MRLLVVSPSGGWYGSEQVLFDYLGASRLPIRLHAPADGPLMRKVKAELPAVEVRPIGGNLALFYLRIAFDMIFGGHSVLYANEAAHVRYISLLGRLLPGKRFVVHVRINEDTESSRWKEWKGAGMQALVISDFLSARMPVPSTMIRDPYPFRVGARTKERSPGVRIIVGVIGRISMNKGIVHLLPLLRELDKLADGAFELRLYGDIDPALASSDVINSLKARKDVRFMGFIADKSAMYEDVDAVLHLCPDEPLGRIFLEAIDLGIPLVGFDSGGIGEIGRLTGLQELLVDPRGPDPEKTLASRLVRFRQDPSTYRAHVAAALPRAREHFGLATYVERLDAILKSS